MAKRKRPGYLSTQLERKTRVSNHIGGCASVERPERLTSTIVWGRRFQLRKRLAA